MHYVMNGSEEIVRPSAQRRRRINVIEELNELPSPVESRHGKDSFIDTEREEVMQDDWPDATGILQQSTSTSTLYNTVTTVTRTGICGQEIEQNESKVLFHPSIRNGLENNSLLPNFTQ